MGISSICDKKDNNMNAASPSTSTTLEQCRKTLEFWHKVEFFIPFDLQQVLEDKDADWGVRRFTEDQLRDNICGSSKLWQVDIPTDRQLCGFELYLGIFDKSELAIIADQVVHEALTPEDIFEQIERGDLEGPTCFARIKISDHGEPLFDAISVSTVPWALGRIQGDGLHGLSFDAFQGGLLELQERLKNFQAQRLENIHKVAGSRSASAEKGAEAPSIYPLSGTEVLDLLEVLYQWAGFRPAQSNDSKTAAVLVRAQSKTISKKSTKFSKSHTGEPAPDQAEAASAVLEADADDEAEPVPDTEIDILNSFYAKDIERAILAIKTGEISPALLAYLTPVPDSERIDLYEALGRQKLFAGSNPDLLNHGHWLEDSGYAMSLMQQFAIGQVFDGLDARGIFSVNGPPGTGKTTLLRDIFAENITRRARILSGYCKASDAFQAGSVHINFRDVKGPCNIKQLKPELTGFEMVVASSNNAAVENISHDLPRTKALGKLEWRLEDGTNKFGYLQPIAHKIAAQNTKGEFDALEPEKTPWGLISCALGNRANRKAFADRISFPGAVFVEPYAKGFDADRHQSIWLWRDRYKGLSFVDAKSAFIQADSAVKKRLTALKDLAGLHNELHGQTVDSFTAQEINALTKAQVDLQVLQAAFGQVDGKLQFCINQLANLERMESLIQERRPGWIACFLRLKSYKDFQKQLQANQNEQLKHLQIKHTLESQRETSQEKLKKAHDTYSSALLALADRQAQWADKQQDLTTLQVSFPLAKRPVKLDDLEHDEWQKYGVWLDEELNRLRSELFAAALQLHEAWLAEVIAKGGGFAPNIIALCHLLLGKKLHETQHALTIWQSLFLFVPVISSTFASIASQFRDLGCDALGWLFIDEAGQAVPQAAVGALWRSKRAVVVGDPLQIEPVFTVPIKLIEALFKFSGLPDSAEVMPHKVSSQNLADAANRLGTWISTEGDKPQWIGSPLRVHRRCVEPMFGVANAIAYDNKMVYGFEQRTPPVDSLNLGSSAWVDMGGSVSHKQIVPDQIDLVFKALVTLYQSQNKLPPLYIISPFRRIKAELINVISDIERWREATSNSTSIPGKASLGDWCRGHIGTVHTFQGKEESIVWMVLGCDDKTAGAVDWAASKPNLLNVALTRAKHRFFMIGDVSLWGGKTFFDKVRASVEVISGDDFLRRM